MDRHTTESQPPHAPHAPGAGTRCLLNTKEAARYLRVSHRTLERHRVTGEGAEFFKVGRLVFYETAKLDAYLERRRRRSTSDPGPSDRH